MDDEVKKVLADAINAQMCDWARSVAQMALAYYNELCTGMDPETALILTQDWQSEYMAFVYGGVDN